MKNRTPQYKTHFGHILILKKKNYVPYVSMC
jgi:hypothetical protein